MRPLKLSMVLECPACAARFTLRRYEPDGRVRCRKCRAVVILPPLQPQTPEAPARAAVPPRLRRALLRSLRRAILLAAASAAVLVPLGWYAWTAYETSSRPPALAGPSGPQGPWRRAEAAEALYRMPFPLAHGLVWDYDCGPDLERHAVVSETGGDGKAAPEYVVRITRRSGEERRTYRLERDGVYWTRREAGGEALDFSPPLRIAALPLSTDGGWSSGEVRLGAEVWSLHFAGDGAESLTLPAGTFACTRVRVTGSRGGASWNETLWFAKGVGIVKREAPSDAGCPGHVLAGRGP
jgi:hypothetical protein